MRRVLLDHCIPRYLVGELAGFSVHTARDAKLDDAKDGELLKAITGRFDVLVTMDRNLRHQQNLDGVRLGVVVLRVQTQRRDAFQRLVPELTVAISTVEPSEVQVVGP